jgi:hypothetical protein
MESGPDSVVASAAGTGGARASMAAGNGGAAGMGPMGDGAMHPCLNSGRELVIIGDSYSTDKAAHRPLADLLAEQARQSGALAMTESYRDLSEADATLAVAPGLVQSQWNYAKVMLPAKVVIMTGGEGDVDLANKECLPDGAETNKACITLVTNLVSAAKTLFTSMAKAGVSDVLYVWYPDRPGMMAGNTLSHYAYPMLAAAAKAATTDKFRVHMIDTVPVFEGHPEYFAMDGLQANDTGEAAIATVVWQQVKASCIGQFAASGCCVP